MTSADYDAWHLPVLAQEAVEALAVKADGLYIDLTAGGGGHSALILGKLGEGGRLYAADRDREALEASEARLAGVKTRGTYQLIGATFTGFPSWLDLRDKGRIDGLLADLGVSSHQFDCGDRGFSYLKNGPLDIRMNREQGVTAAQLLESLSREDLVTLLRIYGEESPAAPIAAAIVRRRKQKPITETLDLAQIIASAVPARMRREGNPARKTFQALRMAVNHEQEELAHLLSEIPALMADGGRAVLISFHSLEDRMVKQAMRTWQSPCQCPRDFPQCICGKKPLGINLTPKPVMASAGEMTRNPRSRSAKLRAFEFHKEVSHELLR
ncbi:MAG: 16S rRNA (cytosine(1402)-N(4))-methyltransferase RsmH [Clostridiaceae bacterium]|nr:16S rRNA (cytosine(1402)-N(4))-methyltransferase RsmH [Clostridiaceae bacterium]